MPYRPSVVVYTRQGCGLCRQAEAWVAREGRRAVVSLVDVDTDEALIERYGVRVPVIEVDGREVAEFEVAPRVLRQAIRQARRRARRDQSRPGHPGSAHRGPAADR